MSTFTLPRFAKTGGKTQKFADGQTGAESPTTSSPSFFRTLKDKLGKTNGVFGGSQTFDRERDLPETPESKTYFSKTNGNGTMGRTINAFAWVLLLPSCTNLALSLSPSPHLTIYKRLQASQQNRYDI